MANHKWVDESFSKFDKEEYCKKCGVHRKWIGGDMQSWEYWHPDYVANRKIHKKFTRPECVGK